jgi:hypothetical protein
MAGKVVPRYSIVGNRDQRALAYRLGVCGIHRRCWRWITAAIVWITAAIVACTCTSITACACPVVRKNAAGQLSAPALAASCASA